MFLIRPAGKISQKSNKNSASRMFDANNISTRSYLCTIKLHCVQADSRIIVTSSSH